MPNLTVKELTEIISLAFIPKTYEIWLEVDNTPAYQTGKLILLPMGTIVTTENLDCICIDIGKRQLYKRISSQKCAVWHWYSNIKHTEESFEESDTEDCPHKS